MSHKGRRDVTHGRAAFMFSGEEHKMFRRFRVLLINNIGLDNHQSILTHTQPEGAGCYPFVVRCLWLEIV